MTAMTMMMAMTVAHIARAVPTNVLITDKELVQILPIIKIVGIMIVILAWNGQALILVAWARFVKMVTVSPQLQPARMNAPILAKQKINAPIIMFKRKPVGTMTLIPV